MNISRRPYVLDDGESAKQFCRTSGSAALPTGVTLAYQVFEVRPHQEVQVGAGTEAPSSSENDEKVLMIMGFAARGAAWMPTLRELFSRGEKASGLEVATFDNRGIGKSSCPVGKENYSTDIMAADALALMDHLGWHKAHIVGHSMGGMIATRLALAAPDRVASLTLISVTCGGTEAIPLNRRAMWAAIQGLMARRKDGSVDPVKRARADLAFHFTPKLLRTKDPVTGRTVKDLLVEEYAAHFKAGGLQSKAGEEGQLHAIMKNGLTAKERRRLAAAGFPIKVIHGTHDILAEPKYAVRLAAQLRCPLTLVDGGHFITRDCAPAIVDEILGTIDAVRQGATHVDAVHASFQPALSACFCCA